MDSEFEPLRNNLWEEGAELNTAAIKRTHHGYRMANKGDKRKNQGKIEWVTNWEGTQDDHKWLGKKQYSKIE